MAKGRMKVREIKKNIKVTDIQKGKFVLEDDLDSIHQNNQTNESNNSSPPPSLNTRINFASQSPELKPAQKTTETERPFSYSPKNTAGEFSYRPRNAPVSAANIVRQMQTEPIRTINPRQDLSNRSANINFNNQQNPDAIFSPSQNLSSEQEDKQNYQIGEDSKTIKVDKRRRELY